MKLPFVSRERYDEKCVELAALRAKYDALFADRDKWQIRAVHAKRPPRDPMIDKLAADLGSVLTDPEAARAEAERIRREAFG